MRKNRAMTHRVALLAVSSTPGSPARLVARVDPSDRVAELDDELRERQFAWPGLWSLLAVTGFLAKFPAGPIFAD